LSVNKAGIIEDAEGLKGEFYTDDSYKAIKRKVYSDTEAIQLGYDHGDDHSMIGLNGYPCNKGLIVNLIDSYQTSFSLGFALSHPLLCLFYGT
jgi:hypothetical protein